MKTMLIYKQSDLNWEQIHVSTPKNVFIRYISQEKAPKDSCRLLPGSFSLRIQHWGTTATSVPTIFWLYSTVIKIMQVYC